MAARTAVVLGLSVLFFAPVAVATWSVSWAALPYVAASAALETAHFALLVVAYRRRELSVVYPIARGRRRGDRVVRRLRARARRAPPRAGPEVAAVRETSIVLAAVFAGAFLRERVGLDGSRAPRPSPPASR